MENIILEAKKYQKKAEINARAHFLLEAHCSNGNRWLGIPVIILTTVVGSTLFASKFLEEYLWLEIVLGIMSLIAAILSSLSVTLRLADKAEKHKSAGLHYRSMVRKLNFFILKYSDRLDDVSIRDSIHKDFEELSDKLDKLALDCPSIKDKMFNKSVSEIEPN